MFEKIKQMYNSILIDNCKTFNENYFYFYHNDSHEVFGIQKTISKNEYELLKHEFVEKKIYSKNTFEQKIYEYLEENKQYPFKTNQKIFIVSVLPNELLDLLSQIYKDLHNIELFGAQVLFCKENLDINLSEYIEQIIDDFGFKIKIHDGIVISNKVNGSSLIEYIRIATNYLNSNSNSIFDVSSLFLNTTLEDHLKIKKVLLEIASDIINDDTNKRIIEAFFKNDLNVSQTAKSLYLNRSSLLKRFELIKRETGFNIQKFTHACTIYLLLK